MAMLRVRLFLGLVLTLALFTIGCSKGIRLVPAEGVVVLVDARGKTQPMANISVQFLPDATKEGVAGPTSYATTDEQGKFRLKAYDGRDGAVVGPHRVVLADLMEERPPQGVPLKQLPRLNSRYTSATAGLAAEVKEGGGVIELRVTFP